MDRCDSLRHMTKEGACFSRDQCKKGQFKAGQLAEMAVLDREYFSVAEDEIIDCQADLHRGRIVQAKGALRATPPRGFQGFPVGRLFLSLAYPERSRKVPQTWPLSDVLSSSRCPS